jgi:aminoglycoside phosphotransferase (APT) family kinase protein
MRERWGPGAATLALTPSELTSLVQPAFPGQSVVANDLTSGGLANTNVRLELSAHRRPVLLRLYTRDPNADAAPMPDVAAKEAALHRLLAPKLPVPRVIFAAPDNPITGHAYMLRDWADGQRLELVAREQTPHVLVDLARDVGAVLAGIHSMTFAEGGFLDSQLNVVPFPSGIGGRLPELLETLLGARGKERLGPDLTQALMAFAQREPNLGASWPGPPSLTHADFGGSNILVQIAERGARVAAVIDWEFAFSGSSMIDLGNLLRPPLGELPGFEDAVAVGYRGAGGVLPDDWRRLTLYNGLADWASFLGRPRINQALIDDARKMISRTLEYW